ncbi:hypothetical protein Q5L94_12165 [Idiomarina sp. Sol25]|uniref:hypothetical protein n=1 Tax=Idiomarina sp. Sol25 TaxID=3064000 RepID=UPI00294B03AB|nr:hypothetical protein [Idiomarina sp. Sol25]MDV6328815.1 hypothetical protein [Idiomarina sp. Sol25]
MKQKLIVDKDKTKEFEIDEAVSLLNMAIHRSGIKKPRFEDIGLIVGVLCMNDEVEVIVKFHNELRQFTRSELGLNYVEERIPE